MAAPRALGHQGVPVTVARPRRWSTTLRSQPTSYIPKPSAGLCGYPVACQSLSFRFLPRGPSDDVLTRHAPGLFPDRSGQAQHVLARQIIDLRGTCPRGRRRCGGFSSEPTLAARRSPRGSPHRTNERLVVNLPVAAKTRATDAL